MRAPAIVESPLKTHELEDISHNKVFPNDFGSGDETATSTANGAKFFCARRRSVKGVSPTSGHESVSFLDHDFRAEMRALRVDPIGWRQPA